MDDDVRFHSTRVTKEDLGYLALTIGEIRKSLPVAKRNQDESSDIRDWINRVRDALYDAEDLFDLVALDALFKGQIKKYKHFRGEVGDFFSKLFQVISTSKIVKKLKAIRENLDGIYMDCARFRFELYPTRSQSSFYKPRPIEMHSYEVPEDVIGREDDKNAIVELLYDESLVGQRSLVIAIAGIKGIGKTTLAQLVYDDERFSYGFESRWWVSIAGLSDEKAVLGRIVESIQKGISYYIHSINELRSAIVQLTEARRYLLVLDDVRYCTASSLSLIMPLLGAGAVGTGSRIIITTPSMSGVNGMHVENKQIYQLRGLIEEESWKLFETVAFGSPEKWTPDQIGLGRQIIKQCDSVPQVIISIARLLRYKDLTE